MLAWGLLDGCGGQTAASDGGGGASDGSHPESTLVFCPAGTDLDGDGYGQGCPAGPDCDDGNPAINPGATEICDGKDNNCDNQIDEKVRNACGHCSGGCVNLGDKPFPVDPSKDPQLKEANGVGLDPSGDLILDKTKINFAYMWIANALDILGTSGGCTWATEATYNAAKNPSCRGTVSKIDTATMKEVARYFTLTCHSKAGTSGCVDLNGNTINKSFPHAPSRTAVDYNFDVWVANRAFGGQPSATKIANDVADCVDRNKSGTIETSQDRNGDGKIEPDCDGDQVPDGAATVCTGSHAGQPPEFLGDDDECVLFTVNYGGVNDYGRSICLDSGIDLAPSNAWVGTNNHSPNNRFYKIDGMTGQLSGPFELASGHQPYGCVVDSQGILWSVDTPGTMSFLNTANPTQVGPVFKPEAPNGFYGVTVDAKDSIWAGGWSAKRVFRYRPDRTSFSTLDKGAWTSVVAPPAFDGARGIAADDRGKVWAAINNGYIWRIDQSIGEGVQDLSGAGNYWPANGTAITGVGVDAAGHIWAIAFDNHRASKLEVNAAGDPLTPATTTSKFVSVGRNPYTYSDFTGFGLQNFTRPHGRYLYQLKPCSGSVKPTWKQVRWNATTPAGTSVLLRVRSGDDEASLGSWFGPYQQSPADLSSSASTPLQPDPAKILQIEFTLQTKQKGMTPILHDFDVAYSCEDIPG